MTNRLKKVNEILAKLHQLKLETTDAKTIYAINANIDFFESLKSIPRYITWILKTTPKLDPARLLELTDFSFPEYDDQMHTKLIEMERKEFPGLIKLSVNAIYNFIVEKQHVVLASLGGGAMELERQVIERLKRNNFQGNVTFFAIDLSKSAIGVAKNNLKSLVIPMRDIAKVNDGEIRKAKNFQGVFQIIFCQEDIFHLNNAVLTVKFDAVYHTLFKHHLTLEQKNLLDEMTRKISDNTFEYDGYRSFFAMIPQTIIGWSNPVFLNAEIFSNLRFEKKKEIKSTRGNKGTLIFHKAGYYLLKY